jgi:hypothetical protein
MRLLDEWLVAHAEPVLGRVDGPWRDAAVVDVGIGTPPDATLALHAAIARRHPGRRTIGVDVVAPYVDALTAAAPPGVEGRVGGATLPLGPDEPAALVRAVNLLRSTRAERVSAALATLADPLLVGGWLVEGSTDTTGEVGVFRVLERTPDGLAPRWLVVTSTHGRGFDPRLFTAWLPRGLGRHARPAPELAARFAAWADATARARADGAREPAATFVAAAARLAAVDDRVVRAQGWWERGVLWWSDRASDGPVATR